MSVSAPSPDVPGPYCIVVRPRRMALRMRRGTLRLDEDGALEQRCVTCGEYWPADTEFFHASGPDLYPRCRACTSEVRSPHSVVKRPYRRADNVG